MPDQDLHGYTDTFNRLPADTTASDHVRDPHPYTGFTASSNKTEMLMQAVDKLAFEDGAKKRSVLYDPMADCSRGQFYQNLSIRPESSVSGKHASSALRRDGYLGGLDFQRDLLNKSEPLPPVLNVNEQDIDPGLGHMTASNQSRYSSQQNQADDVFSVKATTHASASATTNYLHEQQRRLRKLQDLEAQEKDPNSDPVFNTGLALEELARSREPISQAERDAEVVAWFTQPYVEGSHVRDMLTKVGPNTFGRIGNNDFDGASDISSPPLTARYLPTLGNHMTAAPTPKAAATLSSAPAGIDLLSPLLANLHTHQLNNFQNCPFTRYTMPPAWCVDTTGLPGSKDSFFGEGEEGGWNPPKRVGRDRRRVMRVIEGRATYFEEGVGVGVVSPGSSVV